MSNSLLEWEIQWIKENIHLYEGPMHAEAVIQNIRKEYKLKKLRGLVKTFERTKTTGAYVDLFEFNNSLEKEITRPSIITAVNGEKIVSSLLAKLKSFKTLCDAKNMAGLLLFEQDHPEYTHRVQRKFAELGSVKEVELYFNTHSCVDKKFFSEQVEFFRKNDTAFLDEYRKTFNNN